MNKLILAIMLMLSGFASAQRSGLFSETLSASGVGSQSINSIASGAVNFYLTYVTTGTPAAVSIQLEGSVDGTTFAVCGVALTNTTSANSSCTGIYQKVRANLTSLTGGTAPTVIYTISANYGSAPNSAGSTVVVNAGADSDALANNPTGFLSTPSGNVNGLSVFPSVFNGATWDRIRGSTDGLFMGKNASAADAIANTAAFPQANAAGGLVIDPLLFNGSTWDRQRSVSLSNFFTSATTTARNAIGAQIEEKGSRWAVNSAPAAGSQATASIAAEASVRHVLDSLCFSSGSAVAPVLTSLQVNVRDGATGAGTVLLSFEVDIPATTGEDTPPVCISGLNIVGTTNTAMTVEWSAALANLKQTATAIGFNTN